MFSTTIKTIVSLLFLLIAVAIYWFFSLNRSVVAYPQALALFKSKQPITTYEYIDPATRRIRYVATVPAWHKARYRLYVQDWSQEILPMKQEGGIYSVEGAVPHTDDQVQIHYRAVKSLSAADTTTTIAVHQGDSSLIRSTPSTATATAESFFIPQTQARTMTAQLSGAAHEAATYISSVPQGVWLMQHTANVTNVVNDVLTNSTREQSTPILVLYYASRFDCSSYSSQKESMDANYLAWVRNIADTVGERSAWVILEPDALAQTSCLYSLPSKQNPIAQAVSILKQHQHIRVYIDAGHPNWIASPDMADRLMNANIANADGFSLNVSNFISTPENIMYGMSLSQLVDGKHFVIDTSRNGTGAAPDNAWCNPSGRGLGTPTTAQTSFELLDALLWIKNPGESDGTCNGGPHEGEFWPAYATDLYRNRNN